MVSAFRRAFRYIGRAAAPAAHACAAQLLLIAIRSYPSRKIRIPPGNPAIHATGRAHQISRASATHASAPPNCLPSESSSRISRINSARESPSSAPTRGSCSGATAIPRLSRIGLTHRAIRVQNPHSASKKSQPRACRPFPSVNSPASEIIAVSLFHRLRPNSCGLHSFASLSCPAHTNSIAAAPAAENTE